MKQILLAAMLLFATSVKAQENNLYFRATSSQIGIWNDNRQSFDMQVKNEINMTMRVINLVMYVDDNAHSEYHLGTLTTNNEENNIRTLGYSSYDEKYRPCTVLFYKNVITGKMIIQVVYSHTIFQYFVINETL